MFFNLWKDRHKISQCSVERTITFSQKMSHSWILQHFDIKSCLVITFEDERWNFYFDTINTKISKKVRLKSFISESREYMVKFYNEFVLDIVERIKFQISPYSHFGDQKRKVNVSLIYWYDWCVCQLMFFKFVVPEHRITGKWK